MKLASINVPPRRGDAILGGKTIFIFQDGRDLEDYVEEFISICHLASCDDVCLMEGFWCGLDDDLRFVMPKGEPYWTLTQYINILLSAWGSELCLDEAEEDYDPIQSHLADVSQHDPEPSQSPPRPAEYQPEPTDDGELQPATTSMPSRKGATEQLITTEPELHEPSDQVCEPATTTTTGECKMEQVRAMESSAHCTTAGSELEIDSGNLIDFSTEALENNSGDLIDFFTEISTCHVIPAWMESPPTLPLLPMSTSVCAPLSPDSPSAHPQSSTCAVGSPRVCQLPSASGLEDPSSPPPASESRTPPRPSDPAAPPRLSAPSSPSSPIGPPAPPGSLVFPAPPWSVVVPSSPQDSVPLAAPRHSVPPAPTDSSLPLAQPPSSVAPAPPRTSGSPPTPWSPEPRASPWPSGSSVSPCIFGSPSPPRAPPPAAPPLSVGPLELSALPPPWLLPPSAPPWVDIMAAVWVFLCFSSFGSLLSPPWLLPPSSPPWTTPSQLWNSSFVLLPGVRPPPKPPPKTWYFLFSCLSARGRAFPGGG
ncbi:hypothetical protein M9458_007785, partial [Cirrhinus mrigala]